MAAGNWIMYDNAKLLITSDQTGEGGSPASATQLDLSTSTADYFKCQLHTNAYTPDRAHISRSNLTNEVANGNGYVTGGESLTTITHTYADDVTTWDAADISWTATGGAIGPFRIAVILAEGHTDPADPLICYCVLDTTDITIAQDDTLTIQVNASGILTFSGATS